MLLGELAQIKTGLVLARKKAEIKPNIKSRYRLLTVRNIENDGTFNSEPFEIFESKESLDKQYFTEEGDVLIRLSHPNTAVYIDTLRAGLLVPSYFAIIKITNNAIVPEFLSWYLNTSVVKTELMKSQTGTHIPSTNKNVLSALYIKQLPLQKQDLIIEINKLHIKEKELMTKLIGEKEKLYQAITNQIINQNKGGN